MKLDIKIQKINNLYLFISDLSQWNELVCLPKRKQYWIEKTGKLTKGDQDELKIFSRIFQTNRNHLENIFLFENSKTIQVDSTKKTDKNSLSKIKSVINYFTCRFDKIWNKEQKKLEKISKLLNKKIAQFKKDLNWIEFLCGLKKNQIPKKIKINLLLSTGESDLRAWSFKETIVLECSGWPLQKIDYLLNNILIHECFHIFFKKNKKLYSKFENLIKENAHFISNQKLELWGEQVIFEEALLSSFVPEGYLGEKFSKVDYKKFDEKKPHKKNSDILSKLRYYCALNMRDLAKEYVDNGKTIDSNYLQETIKNVVDFSSK